jgi:hypothetical protein
MGGTQGKSNMSIYSSVVKAVTKTKKASNSKKPVKKAPSKLSAVTKGQTARELATLEPKVLRELMAKAKAAEGSALTAAQSTRARKLQARIKAALTKSPAFQRLLKEATKSETDPRFNKGGTVYKDKK